MHLAFSVDLASEASGWKGTIDIPAQNAKGLALTEVQIDGSAVGFKIN